MNIHEYQAKQILAKYRVAIPPGEVALTTDEAESIAERLGLPVVIKAQIHAGGRGKGGGVKMAKTTSWTAQNRRSSSWPLQKAGWR
jgi:succinyl-CoA synthetase beta subunit